MVFCYSREKTGADIYFWTSSFTGLIVCLTFSMKRGGRFSGLGGLSGFTLWALGFFSFSTYPLAACSISYRSMDPSALLSASALLSMIAASPLFFVGVLGRIGGSNEADLLFYPLYITVVWSPSLCSSLTSLTSGIRFEYFFASKVLLSESLSLGLFYDDPLLTTGLVLNMDLPPYGLKLFSFTKILR